MISIVSVALAVAPLTLPKLPEGECFTAPFVQTRTLAALQHPLVLKGNVRIERDGGLRWEINEPYRYRFSANENVFTEVTPDGKERRLDPEKAPWLAGMQKLFAALLGGNADVLHEWFDMESGQALPEGRQVSLVPANDAVAQAITSMTVVYGDHLRAISIHEAAGGTMSIRFEPLVACVDAT